MKKKWNHFMAAAITAVTVSSSALAADRIKQDNLDNLTLGTSWDTLPTSSDIAVFDATYATTGVLGTGGLFPVQGIRISNPGGPVTINNSTAGAEVAIGLSGIDMSAAGVNLNIQRLRVDASHTWNIASGRTLNIGNSSSARAGVLSLGSGGPFTITKAGAGTVQLDTSNTAIGTVNWDIQDGLIRAIWNGSSAWGTGTITLGGGGIAVGTNFSGSVGNWTWNNNVSLTSSTNSFIDNQNISGADRWLKLAGVISGSGHVEFRDTGTGFNNANFGFILSGDNTHTGTVTIATNAEVRVGATTAADANTGNNGKLAADSASVVNNGTLSFSRLDAHTVANNISGTGSLRIGLSAIVGTATTTQVVTLSGTNTYAGATTVNNGRLDLAGSLTSNITVLAAGNISGTGSTTGTLSTVAGSGIFLAGGNTLTGLVANGVAIGGATTVSFLTNPTAATAYDVFTYGAGGLTGFANLTAAWRGSFSDDTSNQKVTFLTGASALRTWNTTSGTWDNTGTNANWAEGDFKFYDGDDAVFGDIASNSTVTLSGNIAPGSVLVQNAANAYTFSGGALSGATGLTKSSAGTLILTNTNTNTGTTTVSGGVLDVGNGGATGSLGSGAVSVGTGAEVVFNRSNNITVSNTISGDGLVTKKGAGRMTVNGNNSGGTVNWHFTGTGNGDIGFSNANAIGGSGSTITLAASATGSTFFATGGNSSDVGISIGSSANFTWNGSTGNTNTLSGEISGSGTFTKVSGENLILTGTNTFTGAISISGGGTLQIGGSGVIGSGNHAGAIANSNILFINTSSNQTLSGTISGGGRIDKSNSGELTLSGTNNYSGGTELLGGALRVNALAGIGTGYLAVKNGATFVYQGSGSETTTRNLFLDLGASNIGVTNASASLTWNDAAAKNGAFTKTGAGTLALGGGFSGAASVTVNGGTLRLNAAGSQTGVTDIQSGTLELGHASALANSSRIIVGASTTLDVSDVSWTLGTSQTLSGTGTVAGNAAIAGVIDPGSSPGTLTISGDLDLLSSSVWKVEIGGTGLADFDRLVGIEQLTAGGSIVVSLIDAFSPALNDSFQLASFASFVNNGYTIDLSGAVLDSGLSWDTNAFATSGAITVIPEPSMALLGGLGLLALLRRRR